MRRRVRAGELRAYLDDLGALHRPEPEVLAAWHACGAAGDDAARRRLWEAHLPLVVWVAARSSPVRARRLAMADAVAAGNLHLGRLVAAYDPATGRCFSTYAVASLARYLEREVAALGPVTVPCYLRPVLLAHRRAGAEAATAVAAAARPGRARLAAPAHAARALAALAPRSLSVGPLASGIVDPAPGPEAAAIRAEAAVLAARAAALACDPAGPLGPRGSAVLVAAFGLAGAPPEPPTAIGRRLGLRPPAPGACALIAEALAALRRHLGDPDVA